MRLPDYSGPFAVGAIDLEVPAREPRTFGAQYVSNYEINPPSSSKRNGYMRNKPKLGTPLMKDPSSSSSPLASSKAPSEGGHAKKVAEKARRKAHARHEEGEGDHDANDQLKQNSAEGAKQEVRARESSGAEDDEWKDWNPLSGGAKTSTLHFATVLFTIFYPSSVKPNERKQYSELAWIGRPKKRGFSAFMSYLGQYGAVAMPAAPALISLVRAQIPALAAAPLADPNSSMARAPPPNSKVEMGNFGGQPPAFPVMVFSHGLAGNRLSYSQFCGELASHGIVVAALEHRDGSGVASLVRAPLSMPKQKKSGPGQSDAKKLKLRRERSRKGGSRSRTLQVKYFPFEKVGLRSFAEDPDKRETGLRLAQIAMRQAELRECLHVLQQITAGHGEEIARQSTRSFTGKLAQGQRLDRSARRKRAQQEAQMLQQWEGKLDVDFPALCGHSFGGATVIEMQRKAAEETSEGDRQESDKKQEEHGHSREARNENESKSPFPYVIVLDPWVDPVLWKGDNEEKSKKVDRDSRPVQGPIYVINSETFTVWREHFAKLKRIMRDSLNEQEAESDGHKHGWLMTLAGCQHLDFSDLPLILPHVFRSTVGPRKTIAIFTRAAYTQMGLVRQRRRDCEDLPGVKSKDVWPEDEAKSEKKARIKQEVADDLQRGQKSELTTKVDRVASTTSSQCKSEDPKASGEKDDAADLADSDQQNTSTENSTGNNSEARLDDQMPNEQEKLNNEPNYQRANEASNIASQASKSWEEKRGVIKEQKDAATDRFWHAQNARKERERRRRILQQRRERGLHAHIAERTADGDVRGIPADKGENSSREEEEAALAAIDFSNTPGEVSGDPDAETVHASLSDLVRKLDYKKVKIHSLMAFLFRAKGLQPGLDQPGRVLVHKV